MRQSIEDDADSRILLKRLLEDHEARVVAAGSAGEALRLFQAEPPDILVSDIGMPGEDGYELIKQVRRLEAESGRRVPAIALTAYTRPEDRQRALLAGFQVHLAKPVEPAELTPVIVSLLGRTGND